MTGINSIEEVLEFLTYAEKKGFLSKPTVSNFKAAFNKLRSILEPSDQNVQFFEGNLDSIKGRYRNLHKDLTSSTIDEYGRRIIQSISDFKNWKSNPTVWENAATAKTSRVGNSKVKRSLDEPKVKETAPVKVSSSSHGGVVARTVTIPLRPGFDAIVSVPSDLLTQEEHLKIGVGLLTFCKDFGNFAPDKIQWPMPIKRD